jgi:hypothetical protein
MFSFEHLNVKQLRQIIREYNLITKITVSKKTKSQLVADIKKHLYIDDEGLIKFIEQENNIAIPTKPQPKIKVKKEAKTKDFTKEIEKTLEDIDESLKKSKLKKSEQNKLYNDLVSKIEKIQKIQVEQSEPIEQPKPMEQPKPKQKEGIDLIIDEWDSPYLGYVIDQNDDNLANSLSKTINNLNDKNKVVQDTLLLSLTKKLNDKIIEKYGPKGLMDGLKTIAQHYGVNDYLDTFFEGRDLALKKGVMKEANRVKMFKEFDNIRDEIRGITPKNLSNVEYYKKIREDEIKKEKAFQLNLTPKELKEQMKQKKFLEEKLKELIKNKDIFDKLYKDKNELLKFPGYISLLNEIEETQNRLSGSGKQKENYGLHAVIIKKPYDLEEAKKKAQEFIKDKKKKYYRETSSSYRFRNIPKQKFISKTFRTKKINKEISLIFGELKPEHSHLSGSGIFDFFKKGVEKVKEFFSPRLDGYSNTSKKTLEQYGNLPIKSLTIYRTPISSLIDKALNLISFGKFGDLKKQYGFDKLFHLALVANVGNKNIIIEKNEVVNISTEYKTSKDTETFTIDIKGQTFTVNEMLDKARKNVGDKTFFDYDAFKNNCQFFIRYCLEAIGLYTEPAKNFLFQDVEGIYKGLPSYVSKIAKVTTRTGAVVSKILGKGNKKMKQKIYK